MSFQLLRDDIVQAGLTIERAFLADRKCGVILACRHDDGRPVSISITSIAEEAFCVTGLTGFTNLIGRKLLSITEFTPTEGDPGFCEGVTYSGEAIAPVGVYITAELPGEHVTSISASLVGALEGYEVAWAEMYCVDDDAPWGIPERQIFGRFECPIDVKMGIGAAKMGVRA